MEARLAEAQARIAALQAKHDLLLELLGASSLGRHAAWPCLPLPTHLPPSRAAADAAAGEREEQLDEEREDLEEVKDAYRVQLEELMRRVAETGAAADDTSALANQAQPIVG